MQEALEESRVNAEARDKELSELKEQLGAALAAVKATQDQLGELTKNSELQISRLMEENESVKAIAVAAQAAATHTATDAHQEGKESPTYAEAVAGKQQHHDQAAEEAAEDGAGPDAAINTNPVYENRTEEAQDEHREEPLEVPPKDETLSPADAGDSRASDVIKNGSTFTGSMSTERRHIKLQQIPHLESPASSNWDNFSIRFTGWLAASPGDWVSVLLAQEGNRSEQQHMFAVLVTALKDDNALNKIRRHYESNSATKGTDAWRTLEKAYAGRAPHRIQALMRKLKEPQSSQETMERYTTRVITASSQLAAVGQELSDSMVCHQLLVGIRQPDYEHAVHQLLHDEAMMDDLTATVDYLVVAGTRVETNAKRQRNHGHAFAAGADGFTAVGARGGRRSRQPRPQNPRSQRSSMGRDREFPFKCWACGEKGHRHVDCPNPYRPAPGTLPSAPDTEDPSALMATREGEEEDGQGSAFCFMTGKLTRDPASFSNRFSVLESLPHDYEDQLPTPARRRRAPQTAFQATRPDWWPRGSARLMALTTTRRLPQQ